MVSFSGVGREPHRGLMVLVLSRILLVLGVGFVIDDMELQNEIF